MQARTDHAHPLSPMNSFEIRNRGRTSVFGVVRHWGPCVLTALVVPGGIAIVLLLLWRRWMVSE